MIAWFFDLLDGSLALRKALAWVRPIRGAEARTALIGMLFCDVVLGWLSWYFDIDTTLQYTRLWHSAILKTLADSLLVFSTPILIVITLFPSIVRQTMSGLARRLGALAGFILVLNFFDAQTDWPRVKTLFDHNAVWGLFGFCDWSVCTMGGTNWVQGVTWFVSRFVFLIFATDLFEVLFVVSVICTLVLFVNAFRGGAQVKRATP